MKESIERIRPRKEEKEKTIIERLEEIKKKEEETARENKTGTPWHVISPKDLIPEAQGVFDLFEKGDYPTAKEQLKVVREKIKKMKKPEVKGSNEEFASLFDHEIENKITEKELEENRAKDN